MRLHRMLPRVVSTAAVALLLTTVACGSKPAQPTPDAPAATQAPMSGAANYRREANAALESLATSASAVAEVMSKADPASTSWRTSLNGSLETMRGIRARVQALKPSSTDAAVQQQLVDLASDFDQAAQLISSSIDPADPDKLGQAAELLRNAVTKVAAVRAALPFA